MKLSDLIRQTCAERSISLAELGRRTGQSPQNISMKLKRDSISFQEFLKFMDAMGVQVDVSLSYSEGGINETTAGDPRDTEKIAILEENLKLEKKSAEYQKRLNRDIRTSLQNFEGYTDLALRHPDDKFYVIDCLKKIKAADTVLRALLDKSLYTYEEDDGQTGTYAVPSESGKVIPRETRILLVEDNEMNLEISKLMLEDAGMLVDTSVNGAEAVKKISEAVPGYYGCVLMDIEMPVMGGIEAAKAIRAMSNRLRSNVPIIAVTASASQEDIDLSLSVGMDGYMTKPLDYTKLKEMIASIVR